ncbi:MAG: DUF362 domain-containing protein [Anaerolineae bacterium]|nr:DUF362 domain-containing protein [Anaerolineae bacterium]
MNRITRREFLRQAIAGLGTMAGGLALSACTRPASPAPTSTPVPPTAERFDISTVALPTAAPTPVPPTATAGVTSIPTASPVPQATLPPATATPVPTIPATATAVPAAGSPYLVVARGGEPEELVKRALAALGGMERFVKRGDDVIIKPNICNAYHSYEYASTTNPWVVGALVRLCMAAGARRVRVLDYPFGGGAEEAYVRSGIQEEVKAAGGQMEIMSRMKFVMTQIPQGVSLRQSEIYDDVLKANVVINVPIAKDHGLARLTLGMKNLMGAIRNREALHGDLGQRLADLTGRVKPALTVVDAVRILTANGPTGGNLGDVKKLDTLIVSPDVVAADSYAATLFGLEPDDLAYIRAGVKAGLGRSDLKTLKIEEVAVGS